MTDTPALNTLHAMDAEAYFAADGINASGLKTMLKSAKKFQHERAHRTEPTPAMLLGTYVHMAVLEPERWARAEDLPKDRIQVAAGVSVEGLQLWHRMTRETHSKVQDIRNAVMANPDAAALLEGAAVEQSVWWQDQVHDDITCKARLDAISHGGKGVAIDLKTCADASEDGFGKAIVDRRYDLQAAHYMEAGRSTGLYNPEHFFFIAVETSAPYECTVIELHPAAHALGEQWRQEALGKYVTCTRTGVWPGYPTLATCRIPRWAKAPGED